MKLPPAKPTVMALLFGGALAGGALWWRGRRAHTTA
jgi:hypothetical protein